MVYLGMGQDACQISRHLDAGFILFPFWVGPISVVPVVNKTCEGMHKARLTEGRRRVVG